MPRKLPGLFALPLILFCGACNDSSGNSSTPSIDPNAPSVQVTAPATAVQLADGESVEIRWIDNDADDEATTDVVAIHVPTGTETLIVDDAMELNGVEQTTTWTPMGAAAGAYRIEARTTGGATTSIGVAPAQVQIGALDTMPLGAQKALSGAFGEEFSVHGDGSVTVGGYIRFNRPLTFDEGGPNETTYTSDRTDVFLAHYAPDGKFVWAARTHLGTGSGAGQSDLVIRALTPLPNGGIVAVLEADYAVTVGLGEPNEATYLESGGGETLLVAFDAAGAVAWSSLPLSGSDNRESTRSVRTQDGFVLVGVIEGGGTFLAGEPGEVVLPGPQDRIYAAAWSTDGALLSVVTLLEYVTAGFPDTDLNVHANSDGFTVSGSFEGTLTFGPGEANETVIQTADPASYDLFVASFALDGTFEWAKRAGAAAPTIGDAEVLSSTRLTDGSSALLVTFEDPGTWVIGEGEPNEVSVTIPVTEESAHFVVKYTDSGALDWAAQVIGSLNSQSQLVDLGGGSIGLAGVFSGQMIELLSGSGSGASVTLFNDMQPGLGRLLIARYASDGTVLFAINDGGQSLSFDNAAAVPGPSGPRLLALVSSSVQDIELGTNEPQSTILVNEGQVGLSAFAVYGPDGEF